MPPTDTCISLATLFGTATCSSPQVCQFSTYPGFHYWRMVQEIKIWVSSVSATRPTQPISMTTYPCTPCLHNPLPPLTPKSTGAYQQHWAVLIKMFYSFYTWLKFSFHKTPFKMPSSFMALFLNDSIPYSPVLPGTMSQPQ